MALPLHERALESDSEELVRMTLLEGGASPQLINLLIPRRPLAPGEQYRFHFDMTKCVGCRSCEVACNEQNGNPADIKWRRVGELEGGTWPDTQRTYLSMGCNHCLDASCLKGCPVNAYTKDATTGIVLHSAEACIGCQYCVWNCPYGVPQFNEDRGVVGKCDMCRGRLEDGLEPACVNACPENAIEIEIVNKAEWRAEHSLGDAPGMPSADHTISTTRITLPPKAPAAIDDPNPSELERVDRYTVSPEHGHPTLVVMTTAMQGSFGAWTAALLLHALTPLNATLLLAITFAAMNVAVLHLGRPAYAWRALKMWRRSWLSREVLLFGLFFGAMLVSVACAWGAAFQVPHAANLLLFAGWSTALLGLAGTVASAFIYLVPARPAWNMKQTPLDFVLSGAMIGALLPAVLARVTTPLVPLVPWLLSWMVRSAQALNNVFMPDRLQHVLTRLVPSMQPHGLLLSLNGPAWDAPLGAATALCVSWIANQLWRAGALAKSPIMESRASWRLLRLPRFSRLLITALASAAAAPLLVAIGLPIVALLAAVLAVASARYLFFVSVVPRNMGLTFLRTRHT
ncbi:DmsC/YnfH family molybdoenzyme membrane anchor subunit [Acidipila sp. EB88]|uniref:DmsC/YnfH family molybdoenzyme membrane anchor subunit n=1 Tax=Acidipila sp. EB88 TaxID=2305226 RepID=UPI000F5FB9FE|nr:DmsC/YnfH family molybdoenzyme membrane anchor subunit [Acidipila sp. EB88]RRA49605.1 4Fe-4S ferredoxin [Acidipila sp. EB88]